MEYRKDIAQEMLMYQTKCTNDELQTILVSTELRSAGRRLDAPVVIPAKRYEIMSIKEIMQLFAFSPEHQREV